MPSKGKICIIIRVPENEEKREERLFENDTVLPNLSKDKDRDSSSANSKQDKSKETQIKMYNEKKTKHTKKNLEGSKRQAICI